jgi:hypothetical protein
MEKMVHVYDKNDGKNQINSISRQQSTCVGHWKVPIPLAYSQFMAKNIIWNSSWYMVHGAHIQNISTYFLPRTYQKTLSTHSTLNNITGTQLTVETRLKF